MGKFKLAESPYFPKNQSSEEDLVVRERIPRMTESPSFRKYGTNGNHDPVGQAQNDGYNADIQEMLVSMKFLCPVETEYQSVTSPSGEILGVNVHLVQSKHTRNIHSDMTEDLGLLEIKKVILLQV